MPKPTTQPSRRLNYSSLVKAIKATTAELQGRAAAAVNQALVLRNWLVGAYIVEYEQAGKDRAKYGSKLLDSLAADLSRSGSRGFTAAVLRSCRLLYNLYPQIRQTLSVELSLVAAADNRGSLTRESPTPLEPDRILRLSWSKLVELLVIDDPWKRAFFENECLKPASTKKKITRKKGVR